MKSIIFGGAIGTLLWLFFNALGITWLGYIIFALVILLIIWGLNHQTEDYKKPREQVEIKIKKLVSANNNNEAAKLIILKTIDLLSENKKIEAENFITSNFFINSETYLSILGVLDSINLRFEKMDSETRRCYMELWEILKKHYSTNSEHNYKTISVAEKNKADQIYINSEVEIILKDYELSRIYPEYAISKLSLLLTKYIISNFNIHKEQKDTLFILTSCSFILILIKTFKENNLGDLIDYKFQNELSIGIVKNYINKKEIIRDSSIESLLKIFKGYLEDVLTIGDQKSSKIIHIELTNHIIRHLSLHYDLDNQLFHNVTSKYFKAFNQSTIFRIKNVFDV